MVSDQGKIFDFQQHFSQTPKPKLFIKKYEEKSKTHKKVDVKYYLNATYEAILPTSSTISSWPNISFVLKNRFRSDSKNVSRNKNIF